MTEETAVRIAEALEAIESDARSFIILFIGFAVAFWFVSVFKN